MTDKPQRRKGSRRQSDIERDKLFALALDLMCVCGFDAVFRQINPAFERILGWKEVELTSRPFLDYVLEEDREASREEFRRHSVLADLCVGRVMGQGPDGYRHAMSVLAARLAA